MSELSNTVEMIKINISNSQNDTVSFERKFPKSMLISDFKHKLEVITGGNVSTMQLELYNGNTFIQSLSNDDLPLSAYCIQDGMRIHVIDSFLFDQNVPKFELTQDQYDKRQESVKSFLKMNKLGKYNEEELKKIEEEKKRQLELEENILAAATIGSRCKVTVNGKPTRIGTIMYKGPLDGKKGLFLGVKFDEPLGNNDGSVQGKRYFDCPPKYGSFVPASCVEIGDFPIEEFNIDDEL